MGAGMDAAAGAGSLKERSAAWRSMCSLSVVGTTELGGGGQACMDVRFLLWTGGFKFRPSHRAHTTTARRAHIPERRAPCGLAHPQQQPALTSTPSKASGDTYCRRPPHAAQRYVLLRGRPLSQARRRHATCRGHSCYKKSSAKSSDMPSSSPAGKSCCDSSGGGRPVTAAAAALPPSPAATAAAADGPGHPEAAVVAGAAAPAGAGA